MYQYIPRSPITIDRIIYVMCVDWLWMMMLMMIRDENAFNLIRYNYRKFFYLNLEYFGI